ncbi:MAG: PDZ domain-containing protein [Myxococcota bacterium]|nr:PDZ domain-containing protein [Myxococcota bacterium]
MGRGVALAFVLTVGCSSDAERLLQPDRPTRARVEPGAPLVVPCEGLARDDVVRLCLWGHMHRAGREATSVRRCWSAAVVPGAGVQLPAEAILEGVGGESGTFVGALRVEGVGRADRLLEGSVDGVRLEIRASDEGGRRRRAGEVVAARMGVVLEEEADGLRISHVVPASPAHRAGLRAQDRVVSADAARTRLLSDLATATPTSVLHLVVRRDHDTQSPSPRSFEASVALSGAPPSAASGVDVIVPLCVLVCLLIGLGTNRRGAVVGPMEARSIGSGGRWMVLLLAPFAPLLASIEGTLLAGLVACAAMLAAEGPAATTLRRPTPRWIAVVTCVMATTVTSAVAHAVTSMSTPAHGSLVRWPACAPLAWWTTAVALATLARAPTHPPRAWRFARAGRALLLAVGSSAFVSGIASAQRAPVAVVAFVVGGWLLDSLSEAIRGHVRPRLRIVVATMALSVGVGTLECVMGRGSAWVGACGLLLAATLLGRDGSGMRSGASTWRWAC